ncbi:MAG: copper resistance protein CopC, partial [Nitriliruptor sp.]|uniref:copper resistance CopC/CopD family protein n=1 Tax=Nitriliruptor sp. TaxID=2448056 RepID=UPI00349FE9E9
MNAARSSFVVRTVALQALVCVAVLLGTPAPASAHAALTSASPAAGEQLEAAPEEVRLEFNEEVEAGPDALRVFDGEGVRVDDGVIDTGSANEIAVALPSELDAAAYVVAYRVTSVDAHPIAGTTTFTIGDATALDDAAVEAIAGPAAGWVGTVGSILRGIGYAGTLLAAGAIAFVVAIAGRDADRRRAVSLVRAAAAIGLAATLLHVPFQAAAVSGYGLFEALTDGATLTSTLTSSFGQAIVVRAIGLVLLWVLWQRTAPTWALATASAVTLGSYLLDGHQRSIEPTWLLVAGDAIHLAGAASWLACLALIAVSLRDRRRHDDPVGAADLVGRFSRFALWSVMTLGLAGTAMALPLVRSFGALISTTYGLTLIAKLALVAAVVTVAAYNRRQLVPAVTAHAVPAGASTDLAPDTLDSRGATTGEAWTTLQRTVRTELALLAGVLAITGFLVSIQPAAVASGLSGPTFVTAPFGDELEIDLSIDPSAPGINTLHVYVLEPSGQPSDQVDELRWEFTYLPEGIGPIVVEPFV